MLLLIFVPVRQFSDVALNCRMGVSYITFHNKIAHVGFCVVTEVSLFRTHFIFCSKLFKSVSWWIRFKFFIRIILKTPYCNKSTVLNKSIIFMERSLVICQEENEKDFLEKG